MKRKIKCNDLFWPYMTAMATVKIISKRTQLCCKRNYMTKKNLYWKTLKLAKYDQTFETPTLMIKKIMQKEQWVLAEVNRLLIFTLQKSQFSFYRIKLNGCYFSYIQNIVLYHCSEKHYLK